MLESLDLSTAYPDILLLAGAHDARSETLAAALAETLAAHGFEVSRLGIHQADPDFLLDFNQLVLCLPTHTEADLSEADAEFFDELARRTPDLSHLAFGVVALGDRARQPFAAAERFSALLDILGAVEVVDACEIHGAPSPEQAEAARRWSLHCAAAFAEAFEPVEE